MYVYTPMQWEIYAFLLPSMLPLSLPDVYTCTTFIFTLLFVCVWTGTDEAAIINLLVKRTNEQRQQILVKFKLMYGKVRKISGRLSIFLVSHLPLQRAQFIFLSTLGGQGGVERGSGRLKTSDIFSPFLSTLHQHFCVCI